MKYCIKLFFYFIITDLAQFFEKIITWLGTFHNFVSQKLAKVNLYIPTGMLPGYIRVYCQIFMHICSLVCKLHAYLLENMAKNGRKMQKFWGGGRRKKS